MLMKDIEKQRGSEVLNGDAYWVLIILAAFIDFEDSQCLCLHIYALPGRTVVSFSRPGSASIQNISRRLKR
jgi:hypothetical protein